MSAIELYNAPQSTCSQKVRLTLAEKGLAFKEYRLKLFAGDQLRPEYLALNPNGVVPTVVHDGTPTGSAVGQSGCQASWMSSQKVASTLFCGE